MSPKDIHMTDQSHSDEADNAGKQLVSELKGSCVVKGKERISSAQVREVLGEHKLIKHLMLAHGWSGPATLRFIDADGKSYVSRGYERNPLQAPLIPEIVTDVTVTHETNELAAALRRNTIHSLSFLGKVVRSPYNPADVGGTRNQINAALGNLQAQLKADEHQLKVKVTGDVLSRLLKLIESQKKIDNEAKQAPTDKDTQDQQAEPLSVIEPLPE